MMTKLYGVAMLVLAGWLGAVSPVSADEEPGRWLDSTFHVVEEDEAEYYLADYEAIDGGYAVTIHYADTGSVRLQVQTRSLQLSETSFFGNYQSFFRSGGVLEEGQYDDEGQRQGMVTVYYESGAVLRKIPYRNNQVHGKYVIYFENGQPQRVQMVENNERHGENLSYFENGQLRRESNYVRGRQHGIETSYDADGHLSREATYVEGKLDGEVVEYFPSGDVRSMSNYVNGALRGEQITYHRPGDVRRYRLLGENGTTIEEREFRTDGTIQREREPIENEHGPGYQRINYHADGTVSEIVQVADSGLWQLNQRFNIDGEKIERRELLNSTLTGRFVRRGWSPGLEHGSYHEGELHGRFYVTRDGEVVSEGQYQHGEKIGRWETNHGYRRVIEYYDESGQLHGQREEYDEDGELTLRQTYHHGTLHGPYLQRRDGQVLAQGRYEDGRREGEWRTSSPWSGGDVDHGYYKNEVPVGRWTTYDSAGHRVAIRHYNEQGRREGQQFEFERSGALRSVIEFRDDVQHGVATFYRHGVEDSQVVYEDGVYRRDLDDAN